MISKVRRILSGMVRHLKSFDRSGRHGCWTEWSSNGSAYASVKQRNSDWACASNYKNTDGDAASFTGRVPGFRSLVRREQSEDLSPESRSGFANLPVSRICNTRCRPTRPNQFEVVSTSRLRLGGKLHRTRHLRHSHHDKISNISESLDLCRHEWAV
jgi:hypothetical protein